MIATTQLSNPRLNSLFRGVPFLIYVPGYFIYHWLASIGLFPYFLGGYSNEAAVLVLAFTGVALLTKSYQPRIMDMNIPELTYLTLLILLTIIALIHAALGIAIEVSISHLASLLQIIATYICFRVVPLYSRSFNSVVGLCVIAATIGVCFNAISDYKLPFIASDNETKAATHQGLSRTYLWSVCFFAIFIKQTPVRLILYIIGVVTIFILGSRSELAALIIFAIFFEILKAKRKFFVLLVTVIFVGVIWIFLPYISELLPDNRVLLLFELGSADGSAAERKEVLQFAIMQIQASPILGAYGSYMMLGSAGHYAHNIVSAWVDTGIVGFLIINLVMILLIIQYVVEIKRSNQVAQPMQSAIYLGAAFFATTIFLLLAAKAFLDPQLAASIALTSQLVLQKKEEVARLI